MNNRGLNINEETSYQCAKCNGPDGDDVGMVGCDNCSQWFHFKCVGVSAEVKNVSWSCSTCKNSAEDSGKVESNAGRSAGAAKGEDAAEGGGYMPAADPKTPSTLSSAVDELERELLQIEETRKLQMRKMELEKLVHRRRLEVQRELAEQRQEMEREKRQMELEIEKEHLKKTIAAEEAYRKEQQAMRKDLEGKLNRLRHDRKEADKVKAICAPPGNSSKNVAAGDDKGLPDGRSDYRGAYSKHSTPKSSGANPHFVDSEKDPIPLPATEDDAKSESEGEELGDNPMTSQVQRVPTKAQLSARQFLAKKLPVFTGRPEDWPMFISSFDTANEACGFSNIENLARLQESLKGPALEAVRSRLFLPNAVPQVIET